MGSTISPGTLAKVTDDAPVVMMAHEPMIFHPCRNASPLTLCGHTHGGQINLPLLGPIVGDLRFGVDFVYGHVVRDDRHLIISGGLGESVASRALHATAGNRRGRAGRAGRQGWS